MMKNLLAATCRLLALAALAACAQTDRHGRELDSPTAGTIHIAVDEVAMPTIRSTVATFEDAYPHAKVRIQTLPQEVGFQLLDRDSVRLVVGSRKLNAEERAAFQKRSITPKEYEYAVDAVAVVLHRSNTDTLLTLDRLKGILSGETTAWPGRPGLKVVPVLDNGSGANASFLKARLGLGDAFTKNLYATGGTAKVVDYVAANPGAIGFIGVGYISDQESPSSMAFHKSIRVAHLSEAQVADDSNSYAPYQAYLQQKKYPLARKLYIISGEARSGLGTGFSAWALSEKGQRIVLKAGLLPATMPVRVVQLNKTNAI